MKTRCYNSNDQAYHRYGGAGVRMCQQWLDSFEEFLNDMGERPGPLHSIDRIDSAGNYEPGNCRWALQEVQNRNRKSNVYLSYKGESLVMADWAARIGISPGTLRARLHAGWPIERALSQRLRLTKRTPSHPIEVINS